MQIKIGWLDSQPQGSACPLPPRLGLKMCVIILPPPPFLTPPTPPPSCVTWALGLKHRSSCSHHHIIGVFVWCVFNNYRLIFPHTIHHLSQKSTGNLNLRAHELPHPDSYSYTMSPTSQPVVPIHTRCPDMKSGTDAIPDLPCPTRGGSLKPKCRG